MKRQLGAGRWVGSRRLPVHAGWCQRLLDSASEKANQ
jgi:hypothetical protein